MQRTGLRLSWAGKMRLTFRMIMVTVVACILAASALDTKKQDLQVKITGGGYP